MSEQTQTTTKAKRPKHTPGPWGVICGRISDSVRITGSMPGAEGVLEVATMTNLKGGMTEANASLVSAAPELLTELKALCEKLRHAGWGHLLPNAESAISKAERQL